MEQLIFFLVIYFLYWLVSSIFRKAQERQQPQRPLPRPPVSRPTQSQPGETETAEPEIPPFLREIFGLEKPEPEPLPEAPPATDVRAETFSYETAPIPSVRHREPLLPEKKPQTRPLFGRETEAAPVQPSPPLLDRLPEKRPHTRLDDLLQGKQNLRDAFILKEVLDAPLHRRTRRLPFSPR